MQIKYATRHFACVHLPYIEGLSQSDDILKLSIHT